MKKFALLLALLMAFSMLGGCSSPSSDISSGVSSQEDTSSSSDVQSTATFVPSHPAADYFLTKSFTSEALAENLINTDTEQNLYIYLPPSYYDSEKSYPVVYYLHGFGENVKPFIKGRIDALNTAFSAGASEFILVGVNGRNKLGGSFYYNSPVTGRWEDYVVDDAVSFIDSNFRTLKSSDSRGIFGFSMGGFGAFQIAFNHPDVFSSVLLVAPGLMADGDLPAVWETWERETNVKKAYAQAFSPNLEDTENYGNIPEFSGTAEDNAIIEDWINGYGNIHQKVDRYLELDDSLTAVEIVYGTKDEYPWIPRGCEFLASYLNEKNIPLTLEVTSSNHSVPYNIVEKYLVPFFNENLVSE